MAIKDINLSNHGLERDHDHDLCVEQALTRAEMICKQRGQRLTELRRRVLTLIWNSHEPVKAYDLLDRLKIKHPSSKPVTVYRALDFLKSVGLVHKLESLNAYVGCSTPDKEHEGQFIICSACGVVIELNDNKFRNLLLKRANTIGFSIDKIMIELTGVCEHCS